MKFEFTKKRFLDQGLAVPEIDLNENVRIPFHVLEPSRLSSHVIGASNSK
jgi:hypothetical protein